MVLVKLQDFQLLQLFHLLQQLQEQPDDFHEQVIVR